MAVVKARTAKRDLT